MIVAVITLNISLYTMKLMRYSIRSCLLVTLSFAAILGLLFGTSTGHSMYVIITVYVCAWIVPAASLGFDQNESVTGIANGAMVGTGLCVISMFVLNMILPDVQ